MNKNAEIIWVPKRPCSGNPPIRLRMAAVILLIAASIALSGCLSGTQPTTAEGWLDRGGKSLRDLDYEQAIAAFKKAIEIEPQNIPARISLAKAYADSKRPGDAETVLFEVLEIQSDQKEAAAALMTLAQSYTEAGEYAKAEALCLKLIESGQSSPAITEALQKVRSRMQRDDSPTPDGTSAPAQTTPGETPVSAQTTPDEAPAPVQTTPNETPAPAQTTPGETQTPETSVTSVPAKIDNPYKIVIIFKGELKNDQGAALGEVKFLRPVFQADFPYADNFNAAFNNLSAFPKLARLTKPASAKTVKRIFSDDMAEAQEMRDTWNYDVSFSYTDTWKISYQKGPVVSFCSEFYYMPAGGMHPWCGQYGGTFDMETGKVLKLKDILKISPDRQADILYQEYIKSLNKDTAREAKKAKWMSSIKERCGEKAIFWLAKNGVHIYFDQETFYYLAGDSELVIPYSRTDLLQPYFAANGG